MLPEQSSPPTAFLQLSGFPFCQDIGLPLALYPQKQVVLNCLRMYIYVHIDIYKHMYDVCVHISNYDARKVM